MTISWNGVRRETEPGYGFEWAFCEWKRIGEWGSEWRQPELIDGSPRAVLKFGLTSSHYCPSCFSSCSSIQDTTAFETASYGWRKLHSPTNVWSPYIPISLEFYSREQCSQLFLGTSKYYTNGFEKSVAFSQYKACFVLKMFITHQRNFIYSCIMHFCTAHSDTIISTTI